MLLSVRWCMVLSVRWPRSSPSCLTSGVVHSLYTHVTASYTCIAARSCARTRRTPGGPRIRNPNHCTPFMIWCGFAAGGGANRRQNSSQVVSTPAEASELKCSNTFCTQHPAPCNLTPSTVARTRCDGKMAKRYQRPASGDE